MLHVGFLVVDMEVAVSGTDWKTAAVVWPRASPTGWFASASADEIVVVATNLT